MLVYLVFAHFSIPWIINFRNTYNKEKSYNTHKGQSWYWLRERKKISQFNGYIFFSFCMLTDFSETAWPIEMSFLHIIGHIFPLIQLQTFNTFLHLLIFSCRINPCPVVLRFPTHPVDDRQLIVSCALLRPHNCRQNSLIVFCEYLGNDWPIFTYTGKSYAKCGSL